MALTKKDYIESLTAAKVELKGDETVAQLLELAEKAGVEIKAVSTAIEAAVLSAQGGHIRTYSKEVHGENFEALAQEFVAHTPGATITVR